MPWGTFGQNMRPEGAREALEKSERAKSNMEHPSNRRFSRPFRADIHFDFPPQGIAQEHSALGFNLLAFQANH